MHSFRPIPPPTLPHVHISFIMYAFISRLIYWGIFYLLDCYYEPEEATEGYGDRRRKKGMKGIGGNIEEGGVRDELSVYVGGEKI